AAILVAVRTPAPRPKSVFIAAVLSLLLGIVLAGGAVRVWRIECCWPALREERLTSASRSLQTELGRTFEEARRLSERGAAGAQLPSEAELDRLADVVARGPAIERGVAVLRSGDDLTANAWAGRHRIMPSA